MSGRLILLFWLLIGVGCRAEVLPVHQPAPPMLPSPWLQRVAVLGASASAGFGVAAEVGEPLALRDFIDAAILRDHQVAGGFANEFFFMNAAAHGRSLMDRALEYEPTAVIAIDFLFWFGYGMFFREEDRLEFLEEGLAHLDRFHCPVVISEIPDMSSAIGKMLMDVQVPKAETFGLLNARIREWAAARPQVVVAPLAPFLETIKSGESVVIRDHVYPPGAFHELLQEDLLHPTTRGLAALALLSLNSLEQLLPDVQDQIQWDVNRLHDQVMQQLPAAEPR